MMTQLRAVPPAAWVGVALVAGVGVLMWHRYIRDDEDTDWTTPKETQPPAAVAWMPGQHGTGALAECSPAFRSRTYPGSLLSADFSIVGRA